MADCVTYARVSTKEQAAEGYSIPAQHKAIVAFCAASGYTVRERFVETESAGHAGRTAFGQMLAYLSDHPEVRFVVAHKQDRLYRNFTDKSMLEEALGIKTRYVVGDLGDSPEGELARDVNLSVSKWYLANLRQEVKKGMQEKVEQGGWPHQAPIGYRNDRNSRSLVVDEIEAEHIRWAFERYVSGLVSLRDLAGELGARGFRTRPGNNLAPASVHIMLRNPLYAGLLRYKGTIYPGVHEAIVPLELFERVQATFSRNRECAANTQVRHVFVLRDFMTCDVCGCKITAERHKGHVYYRCTRSKGHDACGQRKNTREEELFAQVEQVLSRIELSPGVASALVEAVAEAQGEQSSKRADEAASLVRQAQAARARAEALLDKLLDGTVSDEVYRAKSSALNSQAATFELRARELAATPAAVSSQVERVVGLAAGARLTFLAGSNEVKREVVAEVLSNLTIKDGRIASYQYKRPFGVLEMDPSGAFHQSWWARLDSNQRPSGYQPDALAT